MRENTSIPWIAKEPELDAIEIVEGSGVILNDPSPQQTALSLGKTLRWALKGKTRSFNALVGFFGHNQFHDVNGDDPAAIIVTEGSDGAIPSDVQEGVGFRLLYGRTASPSASVALRAWYWLSRYRQLHRAETDRKRREIFEETVSINSKSKGHVLNMLSRTWGGFQIESPCELAETQHPIQEWENHSFGLDQVDKVLPRNLLGPFDHND